MSRNNLILAILGGAAAAALLANYLQSEKGKQFLDSAGETIKDLSSRATDYAKNNLQGVKNTLQGSRKDNELVQPS